MRSKNTKEYFEKALFSLLKNKNYHDITVNEICELASKTKMTFYHYYKDKDALLAEASINLVNNEYDDENKKILEKVTDIEEIEYQGLVVTYDWVAKHYNQILNLTYRGNTVHFEIFKEALFDNYRRYISHLIDTGGYDLPSDYISIFFFEGLFNSCLYYAEQLKNNKDKKKVREDNRKVCRLLTKAVLAMANASKN